MLLAFESPQKNGGPVEEVDYNATDGTAIVKFKNSKGIELFIDLSLMQCYQ